MKLFQTVLETDLGEFFVNAEYNDQKQIVRMSVHEIRDGAVLEDQGYDLSDVSGLIKKIEAILAEET